MKYNAKSIKQWKYLKNRNKTRNTAKNDINWAWLDGIP